MRGAISILWRWSWLITLPVAIGFFHWALVTGDRYRDFGVRLPTTSEPFRLWNIGRMEFGHMLRQMQRLAGVTPEARGVSGRSGLRSVNLYVPDDTLANLDSNLPHSGFEYADGGLWEGDKLRKVELRYRGDNIYHWGYYKKSWRVKTKKDTLYDGMRTFNLVAPRSPEIVNNHLSYRLGSMMGIISPRSEVVNVTVNGEQEGIFVLTEQLSEITLRRHGLMPGDVYSGDVVARDQYLGTVNQLFESPGLWDKVAVNNHYEEDSIRPLERLIELVRAPQTDSVQQQLAKLVDLEAFGRFSALETLTATVHIDAVHNWRLYFDPWRSVFVPVLWDPVGWHSTVLPVGDQPPRLDVITSPLHWALHRNGDFLRAKHRAMREFFESGTDAAFLAEFEKANVELGAALELDPNLVSRVDVLTPGEARKALSGMKVAVESLFEAIRVGYVGESDQVLVAPLERDAIAIQVAGRRPVSRLSMRYARTVPDGVSATLRYWRNGQVVERDVTAAVAQTGSDVVFHCELLPRFVPSIETMTPGMVIANSLKVEPGYYELELDGTGQDNRVVEILVDRGSKQLEPVVLVAELERGSFDGMFAVAHDRPVLEPIVLQGEVVVERVREFHSDVTIAPGTTLRMEPGASVIFRGRVLAEGTAEQPIRVLPAQPGQDPWGTVALQGPGASGSVFGYSEFEGGSGLKGDLFEYSAMLSIHDVDGVTVNHCRFSDSFLVDDMVHAVYSKVRFSDCEFVRAFGDAMDLDISEAVVERCRFRDSTNDALDLMTSKVVVLDTVLDGSRDKGISVGEDTKLLAIRCRFQNNVIGVESKDRSVAVLYNADLQRNGLALSAYDKNWQYEGGGFMYLYKGRLSDNRNMIEARGDSGISVYDSYIDRPLDPDERVVLDATVDTNPNLASRDAALWRFPAERERMSGFGEAYWAAVDPGNRGVSDIAR